jgi:hypothetical protein
MNLPIELRLGGAVFLAEISGGPPRESFEMPTAELEAPNRAGEGTPAAGGAGAASDTPRRARRPMTELQTEWLPLL